MGGCHIPVTNDYMSHNMYTFKYILDMQMKLSLIEGWWSWNAKPRLLIGYVIYMTLKGEGDRFFELYLARYLRKHFCSPILRA